MSHNTAITHFETDFPLSNNQNCLPECDREKENVLKDLKNKMDSISNNTPRIDNAIVATKKLISDLCKINSCTVSKTEYDKLQRKYIRLEIQEQASRGYQARVQNKVGCVFPMVVVSIPPHAEFGPNDHQEDAHHFIYHFIYR